MAYLEIQNLTRHYPRGPRALDGISFSVNEGERVSIMGPSGAGKTTLLRLLAGLEAADAGSIHLAGRDITRLPPHQRGIGMVFQDAALFPHLNVRDNIGYGLRLRGGSRRDVDAAGERAAALLSLTPLLSRMPATLSGGERQRVALGRAIAGGAQFLLLDEPLSSLDAPLRYQLRSALCDLSRQTGLTMLYVTHDPSEALSIAHRTGVLHEGRLLQYETCERIYRTPATRQIAGFVGLPPMSFLQGRLEPAATGFRFVSGAGSFDWPGSNTSCTTEVELGLRAEDITPVLVRPGAPPVPHALPATLRLLERDGRHHVAHCETTAGMLLAFWPPGLEQVEPPHALSLQLHLQHACLFDRINGQRIEVL